MREDVIFTVIIIAARKHINKPTNTDCLIGIWDDDIEFKGYSCLQMCRVVQGCGDGEDESLNDALAKSRKIAKKLNERYDVRCQRI